MVFMFMSFHRADLASALSSLFLAFIVRLRRSILQLINNPRLSSVHYVLRPHNIESSVWRKCCFRDLESYATSDLYAFIGKKIRRLRYLPIQNGDAHWVSNSSGIIVGFK